MDQTQQRHYFGMVYTAIKVSCLDVALHVVSCNRSPLIGVFFGKLKLQVAELPTCERDEYVDYPDRTQVVVHRTRVILSPVERVASSWLEVRVRLRHKQ